MAHVDRGADFDGQTNVTFPAIATLQPQKPFSITAWLKINNKVKIPVIRQGEIEIWLDDFELSGVQQRVPKLYVHAGNIAVRTTIRLPWPENMKPYCLHLRRQVHRGLCQRQRSTN
jgi:hypothetical protein